MINVATMNMQIIDGNPGGIKICRMLGKTMITVVVPRTLLSQAKTLPDIPMRGVYYLLSDNKGRLKRVYAGQTTNGFARLDSHNTKKDWWNIAVLFLAPDNEFSMDIVSGLEATAISYIRNHGAYQVDNTVDPKPYIDPYNEAFINDLHDEILLRMTLLGFDLDAVGDDSSHSSNNVFHTTRRGIRAMGVYRSDEGVFEVLAGSQIDMKVMPGSPTRPNQTMIATRENLLETRKIAESSQGTYELKASVQFSSPSSAAVFVLGGSCNGWTEWVDGQGRTLSSIYREGANE